jgi:hypothetical protein
MSDVPQVAQEADGALVSVANEVSQTNSSAAKHAMAYRAYVAVTPIRRSKGPKGCRLPKSRQIRHNQSIVVALPARRNHF